MRSRFSSVANFKHIQAFLDGSRGQITIGETPLIRRATLAAEGKKVRSRWTAKVHKITLEMRLRLHEPIVSQGKWLGAVLRGHYAYYGVPCAPTNIESLGVFR